MTDENQKLGQDVSDRFDISLSETVVTEGAGTELTSEEQSTSFLSRSSAGEAIVLRTKVRPVAIRQEYSIDGKSGTYIIASRSASVYPEQAP